MHETDSFFGTIDGNTIMSEAILLSLLEINNILVREVTREGLFRCLAKYFQAQFACDRISLTIYQPTTGELSWFARAEGVNIADMDSGRYPLRGPFARMAIESGKVIIIPQLDNYNDNKAVQRMLDAGLRSSIAFPLINRSNSIGAVVMSFKRHLGEKANELGEILQKMSSQVSLAVDNMLIHDKLARQNEYLNDQVDTLLKVDANMYSELYFYNCAAMRDIMKQTRIIAESNAPVLICGETGTGKEFIARYIHSHSRRSSYNFVKVNCPALSPSLFESELFGHVKGSFTGAISHRVGRFEFAHMGTIFLDEIGDLNIFLQAKLLHVLQDSKFEKVGESKPIHVNVRCISATNADLIKSMNKGRFRRDLFYRLNMTTIHVPPLRDREGEVIPLFNHLLTLYAKDKTVPPTFHTDTLCMLEQYNWPGNVRELSNLAARLLILYPGQKIGPECVLPLLEKSSNSYTELAGKEILPPMEELDTRLALADVEKCHLERVLKLTNGRVSGDRGAARLLDINRSTLQYKLRKYGISPFSFREKS